MAIRNRVYYGGQVQGVGFRYTVLRSAHRFRVTGFVRNLRDGRVELLVEGTEDDVAGLLADIDRHMAAYIERKEVLPEPPTGEHRDFRIAFDRD